MKTLLTSLFFLLSFHLLIFASLYGVTIPNNSPARTAGSMQLASYKDGLVLYQGLRGQNYNLSPFNDYTVDTNGTKTSFITTNEIKQNAYSSTYNKPHWAAVNEFIKTYLGALDPEISFNAAKDSSYTSSIEENSVIVTRTLEAKTATDSQTIGMTLTYNTNDFIYDKEGFLYNYFTDADISVFKQSYGIDLTSQFDQLLVPIKDNIVYINSRSTASVITVKAQDNQELFINRNAKLIEVRQKVSPKNGKYTASMQIYVFNDPKEAKKAL